MLKVIGMNIDSKILYTICVVSGVVALTVASVGICSLFDDDKTDKNYKNGPNVQQNDRDTVLVLGAGLYSTSYVVPNMYFTGVTKKGKEFCWNICCDKKNIVNAGDTLVVDFANKSIIENITQNRIKNTFVRQK